MRKNTILLLILLLACLVVGVVFYNNLYRSNQPETNTVDVGSGDELKTFKSSEILDFTILVEKKFAIEERPGSVILSIGGKTMDVVMVGTNGENLNEFFEYHPDLPLTKMTDVQRHNFNGLDALSGFNEARKTYYFYAPEYTVYLLSTEYPELYSDLDQIAQSFRYTPN